MFTLWDVKFEQTLAVSERGQSKRLWDAGFAPPSSHPASAEKMRATFIGSNSKWSPLGNNSRTSLGLSGHRFLTARASRSKSPGSSWDCFHWHLEPSKTRAWGGMIMNFELRQISQPWRATVPPWSTHACMEEEYWKCDGLETWNKQRPCTAKQCYPTCCIQLDEKTVLVYDSIRIFWCTCHHWLADASLGNIPDLTASSFLQVERPSNDYISSTSCLSQYDFGSAP